MKIGILTWYFGINYGARAHALGLYRVLTDMGHECEFIQYSSSNTMKKDFYTSTAIEHRHKHPIQTLSGLIKMYKFAKQRRLHYPVSKKVKSVKEIDDLGYDLIVLGSDEIINSNHTLYNDIYYGVGLKKTPYIMYAVSAGTVDQHSSLSIEVKEALNKCKNISVRDHNTAKLIENNIGVHPQIVLDPTLLCEYNNVGKRKIADQYLLIYSFGFLNKYKEQIVKLAKSKNLKIVCVGRTCPWADYSFLAADLDEWLNYYHYASYIVTDSYHGYIFALKNQKNYILIAKEDKTNKIDGLLELSEANKRYLKAEDDILEYADVEVNYSVINKNISSLKNQAICFLKDATQTQ